MNAHLTVPNRCPCVTIVIDVVHVAGDDVDVNNEPESVTGAATVRSVGRMGSYVSSMVESVMACHGAMNELTTSVFH